MPRCAAATARATRRSATRSSASPPTAPASWPTARRLTRSSPTRRRRAACLTAADLASYRAIRRRPLALPYRERVFVTNPPPSSGGALIAHALAVLAGGPRLRDPLSPATVARVAAALRSANAQRTPAFERALYRGGAVRRVLAAAASGQVAHAASVIWPSRSPWTTQISVLDGEGNAASLTCSTGCGSGVVVPGTGVHLNNMLGETDLNVASLKLDAGHAADEHDGAVAGARGRAGRARPRLVGVGAHPLGDRAGRRRGARSRACRCRRRSSSRACIRRATSSTARAAFRLRRWTRSRPPGEQVVRWPGRNIYFGGAQVVARTRDGLRGCRRPAPRRRRPRRQS